MKQITTFLLFLFACTSSTDELASSQATTGEDASGDFALLFADTSTERVSTTDLINRIRNCA